MGGGVQTNLLPLRGANQASVPSVDVAVPLPNFPGNQVEWKIH